MGVTNAVGRGTVGHGFGTTVRGDQTSSRGRFSGPSVAVEDDKEVWSPYSANDSEDVRSWEGHHVLARGKCSDN